MPTGILGDFGDVTADANRPIFLKRKATALFNKVERLVDSLQVRRLSGLYVRLELIDEFQESFKKVPDELEELDFEKIESDFSEKFDNILVILKSSARAEISKCAHSSFHTQLTEFSAPSSANLDIGQHYCPHLIFQNSLEVMQSDLIIPVTRRVRGYTRFVGKYVTGSEFAAYLASGRPSAAVSICGELFNSSQQLLADML